MLDFFVSLTIRGVASSFGNVARLFPLTPSRIKSVRPELLRGDAAEEVWSWDTAPDDPDSLSRHVAWLAEHLGPYKDTLALIKSEAIEVEIYVGITIDTAQSEFSLSPSELKALAELGVSVSMNILSFELPI